MERKGTLLGAALAPCVHVSGLDHFLRLCESEGWSVRSLGPAVPVDRVLEAVSRLAPDVLAVSYRLTADDAVPLLEALTEGLARLPGTGPRLVLGGTPPVAALAARHPRIERAFDGTESLEEVRAWARGADLAGGTAEPARDLVSRVAASFPVPLLRHHYGEPDVDRTAEGAARIAEAGVLDVLSLGPDQNAQEHFFRPREMLPGQDGAGGVPVRTPEDLRRIRQALRRGNHPLMRCYSGTRDLVPWGALLQETVENAWAAIPLTWYGELDGRSPVTLEDGIREKQEAMRWHADRGIPVECNEPHQWGLRDAHDTIFVATSFLAAWNARTAGVRHYVHQMMHNTPPSTSPRADLAKMLASLDLVEGLAGSEFTVYREVRAGIASLPPDRDMALGHMAASAVLSMALRPHILHVVGDSEAHGVADAGTVIRACRAARAAVRLALRGLPDPALDPWVEARRRRLADSARMLLDAIARLEPGVANPWADADVLGRAVRAGLLDAPHFRGRRGLRGTVVTGCVDGGWEALGPGGRPLAEAERLRALAGEA